LKPRILAVDDQAENLVALSAALASLDVEVVTARSGPQALRHLLAGDFALVLMDVQMPEMDGFETAELIKQRERSRRVPILFLTAISRDARFVARGYDVGAVDYLTKPVDPDVLRAKVAVFAELFRAKSMVAEQAELLRIREAEAIREEGERRYRDLAESMPILVWTADEHGTIGYANEGWHRLAGGATETTPKPSQSTSLSLSQVVDADDLPRFEEAWREGLQSREGWSGDFRFGGHGEAASRWHQVRVVRSATQSGEATVVGTATDIDPRRRAEQSLKLLVEVSEALANAQDAAAALAAVAKQTIPLLGEACLADLRDVRGPLPGEADADALGYRRVTRLGWPEAGNLLLSSLGPEREADGDSQSPPHPLMGVSEGEIELLAAVEGGAELAEAGFRWFVRRDVVARGRTLGRFLWLSRSPAPASRARTDLLDDITARTAVAIDSLSLLASAQWERQKLAEANRSKDEFLATLSHELRTPLNAILGWTKLLRSGDLDEAASARALEVIERNGRVQAQLVADLLDVSRIVSGKLHLESAPIDANEVATACVLGLLPLAEKREQQLRIEVEGGPFVVLGDRARLHQVITNLLSNALKFTPRGGSIDLSIRREEDDVVIAVTDSGKGISPAFLPLVFERFRQADGSSTRKHGGLGLGLAIVRHVVELHEGTVSVESEGEGKGARFLVRLPASSEPRAPTEERSSRPEGNDPLFGRTALLVEDDPDGQRLATTVLRRWGFEVTPVGSVPEALEALGNRRFDVLVSDVGLPDRDGYDLLREVRARESGGDRRLPAIALTAFASEEDRARAISAGFDAHVPKPLNTTLLHERLVEVLANADTAPRP
jgi:PAS domain S-box-containing protein